MANIIDIRSKTPRTNGTRKESSIKNIARHHSATPTGSWEIFWPYWNKVKGWGTGGYHEIILRNGDVQLCYDPQEITNGIAGHNSTSYHICVVGDGSFTDAQENAFNERCKIALNCFNLKPSDVLGHREYAGTSTSCPGIDMDTVRARFGQVTQASNPVVKPSTIAEPKPASSKVLKLGDSGTDVKAMQHALASVYFYPEKGAKANGVDGYFGAKTRDAVKRFQSVYTPNEVDGIYGPKTKAALDKVRKK